MVSILVPSEVAGMSVTGGLILKMPGVVGPMLIVCFVCFGWPFLPSFSSVSLSSKDQAEMDPADMEDVEEVEEEETGEDENSKGKPERVSGRTRST